MGFQCLVDTGFDASGDIPKEICINNAPSTYTYTVFKLYVDYKYAQTKQ